MACRVTPDQKMLVVGYQISNEIPKPPKIRGFLIEHLGKEIDEDEGANGRLVDEWNVVSGDLDDEGCEKPWVIPGLGLWIWEGDVVAEHDDEDDPGDITYEGKWRRPTDIELARFNTGKLLWG